MFTKNLLFGPDSIYVIKWRMGMNESVKNWVYFGLLMLALSLIQAYLVHTSYSSYVNFKRSYNHDNPFLPDNWHYYP